MLFPRAMRATARRLAAFGVLVVLLLPAAARASDPDGSPGPGAQRIVSLNPSLTAILVAIGAREQLVGVDDWSGKTQPQVAELPRVGGLFTPSLEAVVGLQPDLVVVVPSAEQRDFRARLEGLGLEVLELSPVGFDEVLAIIEQLGDRVGRPDAARARTAAIRETRDRLARWAAERDRVPTVLVLQRDPTFVIGRGSFVDDMLRAVGGENLAAVFDEPYPRVSREWLIGAAPAVLLDSSNDPQDAADYWSRWPSIPAVAAGRVVHLPDGMATLPGPHLDRALVLLAETLHGPEVGQALAGDDQASPR